MIAARIHLALAALLVVAALVGGVAMQLELWSPGELWSIDTYSRMLGIHGYVWLAFGAPALAGCFGDAAIARLVGTNRPNRPHPALRAVAYVALALWVIGLVATVVALPRMTDTGWTLYTPYSQEDTGLAFARTAHKLGILAFAAAGLVHVVRLGVTIHRERAVAELRVAVAMTLVIAIAVACVAMVLDLDGNGSTFVQSSTAVVALVLVIVALDGGERPVLALIAIACAAVWAFTPVMPLRVFGVGFAGLAVALAIARPASASGPRPVALVVLGLAPIMLVQIGARVLLDSSTTDVFLHDTHFDVGAHHAFGAVVGFAWLASLHAWSGTLLGRLPNAMLAWIGAGVASAGTLLHIAASLRIGMRGMPRRYWDYDPEFRSGHMLVAVAAGIALGGLVILAIAWVVGRSRD